MRPTLFVVFALFAAVCRGQDQAAVDAVEMGLMGDEAPSAIVVLDFQEPVIRVVAKLDTTAPQNVLADIGFSEALTRRPDTSGRQPQSVVIRKDPTVPRVERPTFKPMATGLRAGDEFHGLFAAGVADTYLGVRVTRVNRSDTAIVEIRPRMMLPSQREFPLTIIGGTKAMKTLRREFAAAVEAKAAIPLLEKDMSRAKSAYIAAERAAASSSYTYQGTMRRNNAQQEMNAARSAWQAARRRLTAAEKIAPRHDELQRDVQAVEASAAYVPLVVGSSISVRLHVDGRTLAADVR